ncbi:hypothetical protein AZE42_13993 [Rhizopogon vesiculosus]|uniref:Uncharacterized protein n=1 Tax=Rhizopogon vesiculosus TaxID=180088 RepID=A0A1J8Q5R1_9AGAM|nr:hypothetical protein AZE42_13993 [Rhizopogon vesiculosus]
MHVLQNDAFAEASGILAGTFRSMNNTVQRQSCRWLCGWLLRSRTAPPD